MEQGPIFIGGLDRSGKTPLRRMLSAHPDLHLTRRTYLWTRHYQRYGTLAQPENLERCLAALLAQPAVLELQPDPERLRSEFHQGEPTYERLFALLHEHAMQRAGKRRWGDQLGLVEHFADVIFAAYPGVKMIHMIRDPRDRFAAAYGQRRGKGKGGWSAARWMYSAHLARRNQQRYPSGYQVVHYEDLVTNPEATMLAVCAFLQEDFLPNMLDALPGGISEEEDGPTLRPSLSKTDLLATQTFAKRHLLEFGYPLKPVALSAGERLRYALVDLPVNLAGLLAWNLIDRREFQRAGSPKE